MVTAIVRFLSALILLAFAGQASAYYVDPATGYPGKATIRSSGACYIPAFTDYNAWLGYVYDDMGNPQGWGVVSGSGELLALEVTGAEIRYRHDNSTGRGAQLYYIDMAGGALVNQIESRSVCTVETIAPLFASGELYRWDKGIKTVTLRAGFRGYEPSGCRLSGSVETCSARLFSGAVSFDGWVYY